MWDGLLLELDLCILAYQLHSQSLIWPADPYCEQLLKSTAKPFVEGDRREKFIAEVTNTFTGVQGAVSKPNANAVYHGPGACMGAQWKTNPTLDPIISEYDRINPWQPCFVRPLRHRDPWLVYKAPREITGKIGNVKVACYPQASGPYSGLPVVGIDDLTAGAQPKLIPPPNATDWLYCFEGGTGGDPRKDSDKKYPAWSLMGFVLATHRANAPAPHYDVHIAFRGSRSGKLRPTEAMSKKGNPDWVTDLMVQSMQDEPTISKTGLVSAGFSESLKRTLPAIMRCLEDIHGQKGGAPGRIFVSGHSLGGALACHFASAVTLGDSYRYTNNQGAMDFNVRKWPWATMTVTTFGSPAMGDAAFRNGFDAAVRSCTRVWILADPITTINPIGHVGTSICLAPPPTDHLSPGDRHDPFTIRKYLGEEFQKQKRFYPNTFYEPPATDNPTTDDRRPWAYFDNSSAMMTYLKKVPGYVPADVFKDFIPNLETYLRILRQVLNRRGQTAQRAAQDLRHIITALKAQTNTYYADVESAWSQANQLQAYSGQMHKYVGICLYLAAEAVGQLPAPPAQPAPGTLAAVVNAR